MKEKIKYLINKKSFHICMVIVIVAVILFGLGLIILKYNVEGETNMPFKLGKVRIVSSSEGVDKDPGENKWSFDINQNNDFYIYIERNNKYNKQNIILILIAILFSPMVIGVRFICCKIDKIENRKIKAVIKVIGFVVFSSYLVSLKENVAYLLIGIFSLVYLLYQFYLSGLETK